MWDEWSRVGEGLKVYARGMDGGRVEERSWVDGGAKVVEDSVGLECSIKDIRCDDWTIARALISTNAPITNEEQRGEKSVTHISTRNPDLESRSRKRNTRSRQNSNRSSPRVVPV
jgi:hypothetical protein